MKTGDRDDVTRKPVLLLTYLILVGVHVIFVMYELNTVFMGVSGRGA